MGLVSPGCVLDYSVELVHKVAERVPENGAELHEHVDSRTAQLFERHELVMADLAEGVISRFRSEQPDDDRDRFTFRLDRIESPEHLRDGFGVHASVLLHMLFDEHVGYLRAPLECEFRRNTPRVDGMDVAA